MPVPPPINRLMLGMLRLLFPNIKNGAAEKGRAISQLYLGDRGSAINTTQH